MKELIKFVSILIVVFSCTPNRSELVTSHVTILDRIDFSKLEMDTTDLRLQLMHGRFCPLKVDLTNNTDTNLYYWTNSCSWQSNWVLDNKSIRWVVECAKNVPIIVELYPHKTITHYGIVEFTDSTILPSKEFKLGFVLVKKNEVHNDSDFTPILWGKIESKTDIFWSNLNIPGFK